MSIAKHILMTICAGTVLWLMMLVGGLVWAMLSTPGRQQHTDALWGGCLLRNKTLDERDHDAIRIGQPAIRPDAATRVPCGMRRGRSDREALHQRACMTIHELVHACLLSWRNPDMRVSISTDWLRDGLQESPAADALGSCVRRAWTVRRRHDGHVPDGIIWPILRPDSDDWRCRFSLRAG